MDNNGRLAMSEIKCKHVSCPSCGNCFDVMQLMVDQLSRLSLAARFASDLIHAGLHYEAARLGTEIADELIALHQEVYASDEA